MYRFVRKLPYHKSIVWREQRGSPRTSIPRSMATIEVFNNQAPIPQAEMLVRREVDWSICREVQSSVFQAYREQTQ